MIRTAIILFLIAATAILVLALAGDAGRASLVWLGWRVDTTAAAAVLMVLFGALAAVVFWRLALWVISMPARAARERRRLRSRQGTEALTKGFLAAAAGDGSEARRLASKAANLSTDNTALVRVLSAQAAEAAGDTAAAKAAYTEMLAIPEMRLAALRGLMQTALSQNDRAEALGYAQEAFEQEKSARWAWRAILEDRLSASDWAGALELVKTGLSRKTVSPIVAERARAALLAASAASHEVSDPGQALEEALRSAKLKPGFAPGAVIAARRLLAEGRAGRAGGLIEAAWKEAPHPALWLIYRDLNTAESPAQRGRRLASLAELNPAARESRILAVEAALIYQDFDLAAAKLEELEDEPPTARLAGLMARLAFGRGSADEGRAWMARGASSPSEPEWSDINPEGKAFAYTPADWARLVATYAETGELIHPRFERREPVISELPPAPVAYAASPSFIRAADTGLTEAPIADDGGFYGEAFDDSDPSPPPLVGPAKRRTPQRRRGGRSGK